MKLEQLPNWSSLTPEEQEQVRSAYDVNGDGEIDPGILDDQEDKNG